MRPNKPFADFLKKEHWSKFGGALDLSVPMLYPRNADIFTAVCDYQIPGLYGTALLRSAPAFFLTDDHDMFENDEFNQKLATLPPDTYGAFGAEQTQHMYYPEFLPDRNRPVWLLGGNQGSADRRGPSRTRYRRHQEAGHRGPDPVRPDGP